MFYLSLPPLASAEDDTAVHLNNGEEFYKEEKYQKAKSLMGWVRTIEPTLTTFFSYYEDSDDVELLEYQEMFDVTFKENNTFQMVVGWGVFEEPWVKTVYENTYSLGTVFRHHGKDYKMSYRYRDFSNAQDAHNYTLQYKGPLFFVDTVEVKHSYENVVTANTIHANVKYFSNSLAADQPLPRNFSYTFWYQCNRYNDENERNSGKVGLFYEIMKNPHCKIGYEFHYKDTRFPSPYYSTPASLQTHQPKIRIHGEIFDSRLYYDVSYGFGRASEKSVEDKEVDYAEVYVEYIINDSLGCYIYYDSFNDPTYDGETIQGAIKIRF